MEEVYKDIISPVNLSGKYKVSNFGNVLNVKTGRVLRVRLNDCGYNRVSFLVNGKCKNYLVHRLVALQFIPNSRELSSVNHVDFNRLNNRVDNLEWINHEDNVKYSWQNQRFTRKLDNDIADQIRSSKAGFSQKELARKFGVSVATISRVLNNSIWCKQNDKEKTNNVV